MIRLIFLLLICFSWILGGQFKGRIRDVGVPILIGLIIWLKAKSLVVGAISVGFWQIIRLGYGNWSPEDDDKPSFLARLTKDRNGWWIRAIYGTVASSVGALPLLLFNRLNPIPYIGYILLNGVVGFCVSRFKLNVYLTDTLVAIGLGSIILYV